MQNKTKNFIIGFFVLFIIAAIIFIILYWVNIKSFYNNLASGNEDKYQSCLAECDKINPSLSRYAPNFGSNIDLAEENAACKNICIQKYK